MASVIDILNQSLAQLGDSATISSIDPPEGSAQAQHCARMYPIALRTIMTVHNWGFITRRATLAEVANPSTTWSYAYTKPNSCLNIISIIDPNATDDYNTVKVSQSTMIANGVPLAANNGYTPQEYVVETNSSGVEIILTNQENAVCRYTTVVTDSGKFPPLFTEALSWLVSSKIAGPLLKGDEGRKASMDSLKNYTYWLELAKKADVTNQRVRVDQQVPWVAAR